MGKFRGKSRRDGGGGSRGGRRGGGDGARDNPGWRDYPAIKKENEKLQQFYDILLQLPEQEKEQYWAALKRELPNSFRFCGSKGHALAVKRLLRERYIPEIVKIEHYDGRPVEPPMPVAWYPDELAWWMTTPKNVVRKFPPFAAFQKFLVSENSVGNISRQEVVSMIPPLLMDLRPGMTVLDMCAAPGSKSAQLLEMIHVGEEARVRKVLRSYAKEDGLELGEETQEEKNADLEADPSDSGRATGLLVANDSDYKRGHMLVHQLKRLSSPNLIVTNHDATMFPSIRLPSTDPSSNKAKYLKFDRILADVPCSGDGTFRKNANLWMDWKPGNALGLHLTQVRILVRALQLLKPGGRVVYSTCSMNPVENEAVVASAIDRCGVANIDIVDCKDELPGLKRHPGMRDWKIMDKAGRIWNSWNEVDQFAQSHEGVLPGRVVQTMFPALPGAEAADLPLDRCVRVYPHFQDTGAFFITVLEKKREFRAKDEKPPKQDTANVTQPQATEGTATEAQASAGHDSVVPGGAKQEVKQEPLKEEPVDEAPVKEDDVSMDDASVGSKRPLDAEELDDQPAKKNKTEASSSAAAAAAAEASVAATPTVIQNNQPSVQPKKGERQEEPFKYLSPTHPTIQNIKEFYHLSARFPDDRFLVRNEMGEPVKGIYYTTALTRDILRENEGRGIKFIHGGVRMFQKQDVPSAEVCRWRIQSDGMPILQGYVGEPRVVRLHSKDTFHKLLIEMFPRISDEHWKNFAEIGERVRDIGMGCCVLKVEPTGDDPDFSERMALPLWKSVQSLNLMLPKEDRSAMLLRLFNDTSPLINMPLQKEKQQLAAQTQQKTEQQNGDGGNIDGQGEGDAETKDNVKVEETPRD